MSKVVEIDQHMKAFAEAFVAEPRKEKWVTLLSERPASVTSQAHRFFNYLDHNYIEQNDSLTGVVADEAVGVFYDFSNAPETISFADAKGRGRSCDALFSIEAGKLAVYFYHEGWNFVCRRESVS